jgi:hypothetical protein
MAMGVMGLRKLTDYNDIHEYIRQFALAGRCLADGGIPRSGLGPL